MATGCRRNRYLTARRTLLQCAFSLSPAVSTAYFRNGASGLVPLNKIHSSSARRLVRASFTVRTDMKISARNQIKGKIVDVKLGATTAHVRVDIGGGQIITAAITNQAVNDLGLKTGNPAIVVIKASDVMIAID
jgi:molybdopterin-binding protein